MKKKKEPKRYSSSHSCRLRGGRNGDRRESTGRTRGHIYDLHARFVSTKFARLVGFMKVGKLESFTTTILNHVVAYIAPFNLPVDISLVE
jgi:hypothetical protein